MTTEDLATAVVGVAESDLGRVTAGTRPVDLMAQATCRALEDCGLGLDDIDGVFAASTAIAMAPLNIAEYLGIRPRYLDGTQVGGSSFVAHLNHARLALMHGACDVALIVYGSTQLSEGRARSAPQEVEPFEVAFGPRYPLLAYSLAASRHMHEYGTTQRQLAEVAVAARTWAQKNPKAWHRGPLTVDDVLESRPVATPLRLLDCCLVTDGGGAVVMTRGDRARDLRRQPAYLLGVAEATSHRHIAQMPDLTRTAAVESGRRAFTMAQLAPSDIDVLGLYDAFTITPILFLEDLGFCDKGEGGSYVEGGRLAFGGDLPMNTNGGGLSYNHPGMYGLLSIIEAVRQLRGECDERQVPGARIALVHANGGVLSSQCTAILGSEPAA